MGARLGHEMDARAAAHRVQNASEGAPRRNRGVPFRAFRTDEGGQAVVEFALVLPIVAAFVLALLQFGRVLYAYVGVTHLANEAARYAAVNRMPGGATSVSGYVCPKFGDAAGTGKKVTVTFTAATPTAGDGVSVKVQEDYKMLPFWGGATIPVSYTASMRLEQVPTLAAEATSC